VVILARVEDNEPAEIGIIEIPRHNDGRLDVPELRRRAREFTEAAISELTAHCP
jgi:hypothetical protein